MADNGLFGKSFRYPSGASDNTVFNGSLSLAASTSTPFRFIVHDGDDCRCVDHHQTGRPRTS